jgi:hypothetical protein
MRRFVIGTVSAIALAGLVAPFVGGVAHAAGETFMTVQWCDTREAMEQVVDRHAEAGEAAADVVWDELSSYGVCHTLESGVPVLAILIEPTHQTVVTVTDPANETLAWPAIMEVWAVDLEGLADRPVYIARGALLDAGESA